MYAAAKSGVVGLTRGFAAHLGKYAFLACDESAYISGQAISLDGA
ncbi:MAG: hypothetical protein ACRDM7_02675 [Thermoleophilaceae bacterium]